MRNKAEIPSALQFVADFDEEMAQWLITSPKRVAKVKEIALSLIHI